MLKEKFIIKNTITYSFLTFLFIFSLEALSKTIKTSNLDSLDIKCRSENQETCIKNLTDKLKRHKDKTYNVIIVPLKSDYDADSAKTATNALKTVLIGKNINIVDREISDEIKNELIAIEAGGEGKGILFEYADYAIKGEVLNLSVDRLHKIEENNCDAFGKDCPQRCTVNVSTTIRTTLFKTNPLEKINDIKFTKVLKQNYNSASEESCLEKDVTQDARRAIESALNSNSSKIAGLFIQDGLVTAQRTDGKKHYLRTQLEKSEKYKTGAKAEIVYWKTKKDALLGNVREQTSVAKGKVVKSKGDEFVWIELSKKSNPDNIYLGDVVKISPKCSKFNFDCLKGSVSEISGNLMNSSDKF